MTNNRPPKVYYLLFLFIFTASMASAGLRSESWNVPAGLPAYRVLQVIDGDTIKVERIGKVRYIGIDTPEIKHPSREAEAYGEEACAANRRLVEGKIVRLQLDVQERDKYGRMLAYVYIGTIFVNAWLVENGYATVMTVPPNVRYAKLFVQLEREARDAERGLWGLSKSKPGNQLNGNVFWASRKSDKFHYPGCKWAQKISPENLIVFKSRDEAIRAGYQPCGACRP